MSKKTYTKPMMDNLGSFEKLTKSTSAGTTLDAAFAQVLNPQPGTSVLGILS